MNHLSNDAVAALLMSNIPRDFVLSADELLSAGAKRAWSASAEMHKGHRPSVLGQLRHFHMNEEFSAGLEAAGANPSPIRGNTVVTGTLGIFSIGRFNIKVGVKNNGGRSKTRREMSLANRAVEPLVQPGLFGDVEQITQATVFFVGTFGNSDVPLSIDIAVPDKNMQGWLFRESLQIFANRYGVVADQPDNAVPKLKVQIKVEESK